MRYASNGAGLTVHFICFHCLDSPLVPSPLVIHFTRHKVRLARLVYFLVDWPTCHSLVAIPIARRWSISLTLSPVY